MNVYALNYKGSGVNKAAMHVLQDVQAPDTGPVTPARNCLTPVTVNVYLYQATTDKTNFRQQKIIRRVPQIYLSLKTYS